LCIVKNLRIFTTSLTNLKQKQMKTITTTQYWKNKRSKLIWSVQQSENDIIIFRNNMTKTISIDNLLKNYIKK